MNFLLRKIKSSPVLNQALQRKSCLSSFIEHNSQYSYKCKCHTISNVFRASHLLIHITWTQAFDHKIVTLLFELWSQVNKQHDSYCSIILENWAIELMRKSIIKKLCSRNSTAKSLEAKLVHLLLDHVLSQENNHLYRRRKLFLKSVSI